MNKKFKTGISKNGEKMHYSVGAIIKKDRKYLLVDRINIPLGFAGIAGHIDSGESEIRALKREIFEESGLKVVNYKKLLEEEVDGNECSKEANVHYWYLFECECIGKIKLDKKEAKSIRFYSVEEIKKMKLEPVWRYWFKKLGVL